VVYVSCESPSDTRTRAFSPIQQSLEHVAV
jgi:hypothetical protein